MFNCPWGEKDDYESRDEWLKENGLTNDFRSLVKAAKSEGIDEPESNAISQIIEDYELINREQGGKGQISKDDWLWAFKNYANDSVKRKDAPSLYAWSLLKGAKNDNAFYRNIEARVAKELFGGENDDDDSRAFVKSGLPEALRQRFSGVLGKAKQLLSDELPCTMGHS